MSNVAIGGPSGYYPETEDMILLTHAAGVTKGGIYAIDTTAVNTSLAFSTVRAITTADYVATNAAVGSIWVVALETTAATAGLKARFRLRGYVDALVDGTTDVAVGDLLTGVVAVPGNLAKAGDPTGTTIVWQNVCAIACEARSANTVGLQRVFFSGDFGGRGISYSLA